MRLLPPMRCKPYHAKNTGAYNGCREPYVQRVGSNDSSCFSFFQHLLCSSGQLFNGRLEDAATMLVVVKHIETCAREGQQYDISRQRCPNATTASLIDEARVSSTAPSSASAIFARRANPNDPS
jgi:hypothetical protein